MKQVENIEVSEKRTLQEWEKLLSPAKPGNAPDIWSQGRSLFSKTFAGGMSSDLASELHKLIIKSTAYRENRFGFQYLFGILQKMTPAMRADIGREMFPNSPPNFSEKGWEERKNFVDCIKRYSEHGGLQETLRVAAEVLREDPKLFRLLTDTAIDLSYPSVMPIAFFMGKAPMATQAGGIEHTSLQFLYNNDPDLDRVRDVALAHLSPEQLSCITQPEDYSPTRPERGAEGIISSVPGFTFPKFRVMPVPGTSFVYVHAFFDYDPKYSSDKRISGNNVTCVMPQDHPFLKDILFSADARVSQFALQFLFMAVTYSTERQLQESTRSGDMQEGIKKRISELHYYLSGAHVPPGSTEFKREPPQVMLFGRKNSIGVSVPPGPRSPGLSELEHRRFFSSDEDLGFPHRVQRVTGSRREAVRSRDYPEGFPKDSMLPASYCRYEPYDSPVIAQLEELVVRFTAAADESFFDQRREIGDEMLRLLRNAISQGMAEEEALQLTFLFGGCTYDERDRYFRRIRIPAYKSIFESRGIPTDIRTGIANALSSQDRAMFLSKTKELE